MNTTKHKTVWRSSEVPEGADMVVIPRALALDLVKCISESHFIHAHGFSDDELNDNRHEKAFADHRERMERLEGNLVMHLCDEGLLPSADLILRSLAMAYEVAEDIQIPA